MAPINLYQERLEVSVAESKKVVEEYKTFCLSKGVSYGKLFCITSVLF